MVANPPEKDKNQTRTEYAASLVKIRRRAARPCRATAIHEAAIRLQKAMVRQQQRKASARRLAAPLRLPRREAFTARGNAIVPAASVAMVQARSPRYTTPPHPPPPTPFLSLTGRSIRRVGQGALQVRVRRASRVPATRLNAGWSMRGMECALRRRLPARALPDQPGPLRQRLPPQPLRRGPGALVRRQGRSAQRHAAKRRARRAFEPAHG